MSCVCFTWIKEEPGSPIDQKIVLRIQQAYQLWKSGGHRVKLCVYTDTFDEDKISLSSKGSRNIDIDIVNIIALLEKEHEIKHLINILQSKDVNLMHKVDLVKIAFPYILLKNYPDIKRVISTDIDMAVEPKERGWIEAPRDQTDENIPQPSRMPFSFDYRMFYDNNTVKFLDTIGMVALHGGYNENNNLIRENGIVVYSRGMKLDDDDMLDDLEKFIRSYKVDSLVTENDDPNYIWAYLLGNGALSLLGLRIMQYEKKHGPLDGLPLKYVPTEKSQFSAGDGKRKSWVAIVFGTALIIVSSFIQ